MINKVIKFFFPEKTRWNDIGMYESKGYYYLIQMRVTTKNNKKEFRKASLGFVNDFTQRQEIFKKAMD